MVKQLFAPEPPTALEQAKEAAKRKTGSKPKKQVSMKAYTCGVTDVYREDGETYVETLYEDMDGETLTFSQFLERHAFHDDLHRQQRIADIAARHELLRPPAGKAIRKRKQARQRNIIQGVRAAALTIAIAAHALGSCSYPGGDDKKAGKGGSSAIPSQHSWVRPGIFPRLCTLPAPPGGRPVRPSGPGLPSGGASADYD